ncbi:MAG TPA: MFS transporter [Coleofasciculaceae cyanobacterium]|jgi:EmrB/QacA subfamily drug resistance transporter
MANIIKQPCDEGVIRSNPCTAPCTQNARIWVLVATILGSSMAFIDSTVVNVALPTLQTELNATVADAQWVVESYALFVAALILVGGSLGDHLGRRRIFASGVALFAIASVWCGLAPNVQQLIFARGVQGVGAALLIPGSLAIISASFTKDQRGGAIGLWSGFTAITSAIGPVLGGWLIENFSWRWIFFINIPLALVVLGISFWRVPESRDVEANSSLDLWGALLVMIGLGSVVYGLLESAIVGLSNPVVLSAIFFGAAILGAFILVESRIPSPMMPLTLFRSRTFSGANLLTLLLYSALGGALFFLPFNLIQVQGYSATAAGAALVPFPIIMFFLSRWSGGLVSRYGAKLPLMIGPTLAAVGFGLMAIPGIGGSYWTTFFPAVVVLGLGMTICVAPLTTAAMNAVKVRYAGVASGINNAVSRIASLLSIAVLGIVVLSTFNNSLDKRIASLELSPQAQQFLWAQRINLAAAKVPPGLSNSLSAALKRAIAASFVDSFRLVMLIAVGLAIASAVVAFWISDRECSGCLTDARKSKKNSLRL